ncbi:MAG TPA: hypothetical protein VK101_07455, partial [Limnochordia bacterium]|nr:hypothetical protein [Limnochordia bacterium]
ILPLVGRRSPASKRPSVDFPEPEEPTMLTRSPLAMVKEMWEIAGVFAPGYWKLTSSSVIKVFLP